MHRGSRVGGWPYLIAALALLGCKGTAPIPSWNAPPAAAGGDQRVRALQDENQALATQLRRLEAHNRELGDQLRQAETRLAEVDQQNRQRGRLVSDPKPGPVDAASPIAPEAVPSGPPMQRGK